MAPISTPELQFAPLAPELILAAFGLILLMMEAFDGKGRNLSKLIVSLVGVAGAAVAAVMLWDWDGDPTVLAGMISADRFAVMTRLVILAVSAVALIFTYHYFRRTGEGTGEIYALMIFAVSGMTLMVASADLIMVFLALEIFSLSLYILTGSSMRMASGEAALKYFLLGAFSSAFFLYGVAMTYGATGTTKIVEIGATLSGKTEV
ncbi:MAG: NADH-quinone oxidoreductase subunit N, partial [Actinobacteria bacterium]|nr:NADH-quinone oxidoreductase subunit N [Actinomycetota bacterium]